MWYPRSPFNSPKIKFFGLFYAQTKNIFYILNDLQARFYLIAFFSCIC